MALPATDTFTGADGTALATYSASWTVNTGAFLLFTNGVRPNNGSNDSLARWNADAFTDAQYAQITPATLSVGVMIGCAVRVSNAGATTAYGFYADGDCYFYKIVAGVWTQFGSDGAFSAGQTLRVEANGTSIRPMTDGSTNTEVGGTVTDSAIASGSAGIGGWGNGTGTRGDNWEGGNIADDPTFIAAGAQTVTLTSGATLSPALPTGWAVGDFMLLVLAGRCNGSTIQNAVSAGWTQRGAGQFREIGAGATDLHIDIWYRIAQSGDSAPTVTPDADFLTSGTTGGASAQIAAYRNVSRIQPFDIETDGANSAAAASTWTPPAVTTVTPRSLVVSAVASADDNALNFNTANSFNVDLGGASYDTTTGSDHAVGVGSKVQNTPGAVTMCIWNQSAVGSDAWVGITTALRAANADPPPLRTMWPINMLPSMVQ